VQRTGGRDFFDHTADPFEWEEPIRDGLDAAAQGGAMTEAEASELRSRLDSKIAEAAKIPPSRALYLPVVLVDATTLSTELTRPRALAGCPP
jgi:hypothetical protein